MLHNFWVLLGQLRHCCYLFTKFNDIAPQSCDTRLCFEIIRTLWQAFLNGLAHFRSDTHIWPRIASRWMAGLGSGSASFPFIIIINTKQAAGWMDGWMAGKWMGFHWVFATTHVLLLFFSLHFSHSRRATCGDMCWPTFASQLTDQRVASSELWATYIKGFF